MFPLPRRMMVGLILTILIISAAGFWFYRAQERYLRDKVEQDLAGITHLKVNQIVDWRKEQLLDAGVLMENPFLIEKISRCLEEPNPLSLAEFHTFFLSLQKHRHCRDVLLVAPDGKVQMNLVPDVQRACPPEALAKAQRQRGPILVDLHADAPNDSPSLTLVIPFFKGPASDSALVGALVLEIDAQDFLYPLIQSWPTSSTTAETLLVRREGGHVLFLNELRHQRGTALKLKFPLSQDGLPAAMVVKGERGARFGKDYRGTRVISVMGAIPGSPWFVVTKMDEQEAFSVWRIRSKIIIAIWVGLVALIGTIGVVLWQRNQRVHYQALYTAEAMRRAQEIRYGITLKSVGDGVIVTDCKGRIELLNPVAEQLTGWSNAEARNQPVGKVFQIINEITRQPAPSPVDRALEKGLVGGVAKHTLLIRRDGSEHPITDSGAPIYDENKVVLGAVLVFRDQTVEREAQRAQESYQNLFENMLDGFALHSIILDAQGKPVDYQFLAVNPAFERLTGLKAEAVVGKTVLEVMPQIEPHWIEIYGQVALTGEPAFFEEYSQALDKHLEVTAFRPAPQQFACFFVDITERKKTDARLSESAAQFRQAFDLSPIGVVMVGIDKRFIRVNQAFMKFVGYSEKELLGKSFADITYPADVERGAQELDGLIQGRIDRAMIQKRYLRKGGGVAWGEVSLGLVRDEAGAPLYFLALTQDITDRKRTQDRLEIQSAMLDVAPCSITVHDRDGHFLYANRKTLEMHGYSDAEMMALNLHQLDVPASEIQIQNRIQAIAEKGEAMFDVDHIRKDGTRFPLSIYAKQVTWGGVPAILSIGSDLTEHNAAQAEQVNLQEQLAQSQKIESVGRLAGGVAHDFNNMLGVILGHVEMAQLLIKPDNPLFADLEEIRKAGQRSAELTRQLLAFARKQTIAPKVLDLNDVIPRMIKMLQRLIGENVDLVWIPGARLKLVKLDPIQVDQILTNLCVNARDAISGEGKITIETANVSLDEHFVAIHPGVVPGNYVMMGVSDNGCGMNKEVRQHLFEPFFTTKKVGQGTGLGLATTYGIVKQNHGFINIYSEPGKGTTFKIYLPQCENDAPPQSITALKETPKGQGQTILLVEDEEAILDIGKAMLKHLGYTVLAASSPMAALKLVKEQAGSISLVITDVVMPEMNGKLLVEQIKKDQPAIKCLFMSGYTADVIAHQGVLDEGVQFLQKPFALRDLAIRVSQMLKSG